MFEQYNFKDIKHINDCVDFVNDVLKDRDWSHGTEHAIQVAQNAIDIWFYNENKKYDEILNKQKIEVEPITIIIFSALLHDVLDHKYSKNIPLYTLNKMNEITSSLGYNSKTIINKIIKNISYSNEIKNGIGKMEPDILILRNIVSDADKIEALGHIGFKRCVFYQNQIGTKNTSEKNLENAKNHIKTKILNIYPKYLHTKLGLQVGKDRSDILKQQVYK